MSARKKPAKLAPLPSSFELAIDTPYAGSVFLTAMQIAARFASTDDARAPLEAIHMISTGKELLIEATDSYTMVRFTWKREADRFDVLVPTDWTRRVLPKKTPTLVGWRFKGELREPPTVAEDDHRYGGTITFAELVNGETFTSRLIEGRYPNLTKILTEHAGQPSLDEATEPRGFNPTYLRRCFDAAVKWGQDSTPIVVRSLDPMKPVLFEVRSTFRDAHMEMLLMPVRLS